ncbi:MAG: putative toxin-antitoxin system toxin component, PIN family [Gemmataceae bacterium]|nr:putative toxin-antitoxin system toxin component, PIN family [Gemmataceae bacterium]
MQSLIGSSRSASARTLDALFEGKYRLVYSPAVVDEWLEVLAIPHIRDRHGLSDDELLEFLASLVVSGAAHAGQSKIAAKLTRDLTDTKFLSLAHESGANYLVTNDHRHLLPLQRFERTRIARPSEFLRILARS